MAVIAIQPSDDRRTTAAIVAAGRAMHDMFAQVGRQDASTDTLALPSPCAAPARR